MEKRKAILYAAGAVALSVLGVVYFIFDPSTGILFPKCPFRLLTGLPCAGCGSQRALHSLLHLDLKAAITYNLLVVACIPLLAVLFLASLMRTKWPRFYELTHHRNVAWAMIIITTLWWILRIIFHWYV